MKSIESKYFFLILIFHSIGHEAYVHHMVLYECHVKDSGVWFDHHAGATGEACYSPNMPPEWTFCLATNAWAWVSTTGSPPLTGFSNNTTF